MSWALFVEGDWDEVFVRWLLGFLDVEDVQVHAIGGGVSKLRHAANEIQQESRRRSTRSAAFGCRHRCRKHARSVGAEEVRRLRLPIDRSFLLPDDTGGGDLETLLEQMAPAAHQGVYDCFDQYETCLRTADRDYTTPNRKARVYAYCHAVGARSGPRQELRRCRPLGPCGPRPGAVAPLLARSEPRRRNRRGCDAGSHGRGCRLTVSV